VYGSDIEPRVLVPRSAVQRDRVMVVNGDGRAEPRIVNVSYYFEGAFPDLHPIEREWAVISAGLGPGERVIISNLDDLDPGTPVRPMDVQGQLAGGDGGASS
jgi:multidrug efflux pump subunit AcrA (membrane-fusion protein)